MCSEYPVTSSTMTFNHFEYVVKFAIPFTTVVQNGEIMTSIIVQIFPFIPSRSYSRMARHFTIFFLRQGCWDVHVSRFPQLAAILFWSWSPPNVLWLRLPIYTVTLALYLWFKTTKNSTSSLYQDKSGIVRLASTYPLYSIKMPPQDATHPYQVLRRKDLQPHFSAESLRAKICDQVSTNAIISTPCHNLSLICPMH